MWSRFAGCLNRFGQLKTQNLKLAMPALNTSRGRVTRFLPAKGALRNNIDHLGQFFSELLDNIRLSGTINLQTEIIVGGKEYVLQKSLLCHFISHLCLYS
jgi:hypothetical protein